MKNIKSNSYFKSLLYIVFSFIFFTAPVAAIDNSNHKESKKKRHDTNWPKKNDNEAWDDEEFANEGLCDEVNGEKEIIIDFQYLLKCLK